MFRYSLGGLQAEGEIGLPGLAKGSRKTNNRGLRVIQMGKVFRGSKHLRLLQVQRNAGNIGNTAVNLFPLLILGIYPKNRKSTLGEPEGERKPDITQAQDTNLGFALDDSFVQRLLPTLHPHCPLLPPTLRAFRPSRRQSPRPSPRLMSGPFSLPTGPSPLAWRPRRVAPAPFPAVPEGKERRLYSVS